MNCDMHNLGFHDENELFITGIALPFKTLKCVKNTFHSYDRITFSWHVWHTFHMYRPYVAPLQEYFSYRIRFCCPNWRELISSCEQVAKPQISECEKYVWSSLSSERKQAWNYFGMFETQFICIEFATCHQWYFSCRIQLWCTKLWEIISRGEK